MNKSEVNAGDWEGRMGNNGFKKEYITGRKDQWDIDYKIMM